MVTGSVVWLTGLSGAGKTTLSLVVRDTLLRSGYSTVLLDADDIRKSLSRDLGYTADARRENNLRLADFASILSNSGAIVLVAAIAPYRSVRQELRQTLSNFLEVHVHAPLSVCESRDPKGLYKLARTGTLSHFTGIDDPYEPPEQPDLRCNTHCESISECVDKICARIKQMCVARNSVHSFFHRVLLELIKNPGLTLQGLCTLLQVHRVLISRTIREETGLSFRAFRDKIRLKVICCLFHSPGTSVKQIAYMSGFNSTRALDRFFNKACGMTPTEYRYRNSTPQ